MGTTPHVPQLNAPPPQLSATNVPQLGATAGSQLGAAPSAGLAAHRDGGLASEFPVLEEQRLRHSLLRHNLQKPRGQGGDVAGGCPRDEGRGLTCPTVHSMPPRKSSSCVPTPA